MLQKKNFNVVNAADSYAQHSDTYNKKIEILREKVVRLEGYLKKDPANPSILVDAFEASLSAGMFDKANNFLNLGFSSQKDVSAWRFREANLYIATHRYVDADEVLIKLEREIGMHPVIIYNRAFIRFQMGEFESSEKMIFPLVNVQSGNSFEEIEQLQMLWLRSMHRLRRLDEAVSFVKTANESKLLTSGASGVASLIAIDLNLFDFAEVWAECALMADRDQIEALVASAACAINRKNIVTSRMFLLRSLNQNQKDGRVLSLLGFTEMHDSKFSEAQKYLEAAVIYMPNHIGSWLGLGWTYIFDKEFLKANTSFENAVSLDRNFSESHGALAVVLALQNRTNEANEHIELAMRLDKTNLSAPFAKAILAGEVKNPVVLRQLFQKILGKKIEIFR